MMNREADNSATHSRPPIGIVVAIVVGGFLLVVRPLSYVIDIPKLTTATEVPRLVFHPHAASLLVSAVIEGLLLRGMYMMRRTAVILYLALTAITLVALINLGSAGWFGLAGRSAIVAPSLYYWKRLQ